MSSHIDSMSLLKFMLGGVSKTLHPNYTYVTDNAGDVAKKIWIETAMTFQSSGSSVAIRGKTRTVLYWKLAIQ